MNDLRDNPPVLDSEVEPGELYRHALPGNLILKAMSKVKDGQVMCEVIEPGDTKLKKGCKHSFLIEYLRPY